MYIDIYYLRVLTLLVPAAFFAAIDRGAPAATTAGAEGILNDHLRGEFLKMSRGLALILLSVYVHLTIAIFQRTKLSPRADCRYIASRIFLHNPPGEGNAFLPGPDAPLEVKMYEERLAQEEPEVNPWFCIGMLMFTVGVMAITAEWVRLSLLLAPLVWQG